MRFSTAIFQIAAREPASVPPPPLRVLRDDPDADEHEAMPAPGQEPPADLDQRVRLSGEW